MTNHWLEYFTPREILQIRFSIEYRARFAHGAVGHNDMIVIAKMADLLDANSIVNLPPQPVARGREALDAAANGS